MSVYVDELKEYPLGTVAQSPRQKYWCHMWSDSIQELLDMSDKIGLKREWAQNMQYDDPKRWHFDIGTGFRAAAIREGAISYSYKEWLRDRRST